MPLRKLVFWVHLTCGLVAGSVILLMSVTGVLLTYQKQMEEWSDRRYWTAPADPGARAPLSALVASARRHDPTADIATVTLYADDDAPAAVSLGGGRILYLDPSTASPRGEGTTAMRSFFRAVMGWHRWFNVTGEGRATARAITGWSNLVFLFLVLSGLYLWFPRKWLWQHVRPILLLNAKARGKARDFNWHHVFGFWSAIPLALVVASASVISFPWASDLAYRVMGDEPPRRRSPPPTGAPPAAAPGPRAALPERSAAVLAMSPSASAHRQPEEAAAFDAGSLDALMEPALARVDGWRTMVFTLPDEDGAPVQVRVDQGWGGQPQLRHTLTYDATAGIETGHTSFADQSRGQRLRTYLRFAHTGEYHGLVGQTVAGIVSLAGVFLVWSGFALAWRRLGAPLVKRGS